jgi:phage-related protein
MPYLAYRLPLAATPTRNDLRKCPTGVRKEIGFALEMAQRGGKSLYAKPLSGFGGATVLEIVADERGSTYRSVYTVQFARAVYVLHVFKKKSKSGIRTPQTEIALVRSRLKDAEEHHREHYET